MENGSFMGMRESMHLLYDSVEVDKNTGDLFIDKKTVYHGSPNIGIDTDMRQADDETVGSGLYCTSEIGKAWGYAQYRASTDATPSPRVYEIILEKKRFADLRNQEVVNKIVEGFRGVLADYVKKPDISVFRQKACAKALENIAKKDITSGMLRLVTYGNSDLFTVYMKSLGYDGLVCFEGGEGSIGKHDTWLLFDSSGIRPVQEYTQVF